MNSKERWLLGKIKDYALIHAEISHTKERLQSAEYRMTANYGLLSGGAGGYGSKVESLGIRRTELEREIAEKQRLLNLIDKAEAEAGLDRREADLIACTKAGISLSSYARQRNIYKSHVYKIRDKALKKMAKYMS